MGLFLSKIVYQIVITVYHFVIGLFSIFNEKAYKFTKGRINQDVAGFDEQTIWFHCASLGEFEQAKPLIDYYYNHENYPIVLTFFSPSGYTYKNNYPLARAVYYLPKDSPSHAKAFIEKINPRLVFFIKYEFWFFYLDTLKQQKIPVYLVSGIFRDNQIFFRFYGTLHRKMLSNFTHVFVQDQHSIDLLNKNGFQNTSLAFDTRFDTVKQISELNFSNEIVEQFIKRKDCFIAGSSWLKDEKIIQQAYNQGIISKLIIAPHEVNPSRIKQIQQLFPDSTLLSNPLDIKKKKVLIIDSIGKLALLYRYGKTCYIGGGFGTSVHNVLEAAVYGKALIYGPNHKKSKEAIDLIRIGAAREIVSVEDLVASLREFQSEERYASAAEKARNYVMERTGGMLTVVKKIQA